MSMRRMAVAAVMAVGWLSAAPASAAPAAPGLSAPTVDRLATPVARRGGPTARGPRMSGPRIGGPGFRAPRMVGPRLRVGPGPRRVVPFARGPRHFGPRGRYRSRGLYFAPAVPYYYYDGPSYYYGDSCYWLKRRAIRTGSRYWWRRYWQCRRGW